jgi:putative membrane protein
MAIDRVFSKTDQESIAQAIGRAEKRTSGEIVVSVVESCDRYEHSVWKGATLGGLAGVVVALALWKFTDLWPPAPWLLIAAPAPLGGLAGYLLTGWLPPLRRWLATPSVLVERTGQRAAAAFVRAEVFKTADRTGILIFLALFEHRVEILADEGITKTVAQAEWDNLATGIARGMKTGKPLPALLAAIERCGELLDQHRLHPTPSDRDELSNRVRTED